MGGVSFVFFFFSDEYEPREKKTQTHRPPPTHSISSACEGQKTTTMTTTAENLPLACIPVRDVVPGTKRIQHLLAADAQVRLEGRGAVVDAGVDDLGVSRRRLGAGLQVSLEEERRGGAACEGARGG